MSLPYNLTIITDTAILDGAAKQVKVPTLVAGGAKSPGSLKAAVERVTTAAMAKESSWAGDVDFRYPRTTYG
jgi:hypothetical protein